MVNNEVVKESEEVNYLKKRLERLQHTQKVMKEANKIIRNKKLSKAEKDKKLHDIGAFDVRGFYFLWPEPDEAGRAGFPNYELTSIRGKIARLEKNIAKIKAKESKKNSVHYEIIYKTNNFEIVRDYDNDRVAIYFPAIPPADLREKLKKNGFHWSPYWKAWTRKLTDNAVVDAKNILLFYFKVKEKNDAMQIGGNI